MIRLALTVQYSELVIGRHLFENDINFYNGNYQPLPLSELRIPWARRQTSLLAKHHGFLHHRNWAVFESAAPPERATFRNGNFRTPSKLERCSTRPNPNSD